MSSVAETDAIEARLAELQRESEARRAELRAIAAALPEVTSRRAQLRSIAGSVVHAPDRTLVVKRAILKVARTPAELWRRAWSRIR